MRRSRIALALLLAAALGAGLLVWAATTDWDSPALGRAVLGRLGETGGVSVDAARFRFNLLRGLSIGDLEAAAELPAGRLSVEAEEVLLEHRLRPLLERRVHLERLVIERPHLVLAEASPASAAAGAPPDDGAAAAGPPPTAERAKRLAVAVRELHLADAVLETRPVDPQAAATVVRGLDLRLRDLAFPADSESLLTGLRGSGELTLDELVAGETHVVDAAASVDLSAGDLSVEDLVFQLVGGGAMSVPLLVVHLAGEPIAYELELRGALDVDGLLGVDPGDLGGAALVFEGGGLATDSTSLAGTGRVEVETGQLPAARLFQAIDAALGERRLVGAAYEPFTAPFALRGGRLRFERFEIGNPDLALALSGAAGLDGDLDALAELRIPRAGLDVAEIPRELLDLLEDDEGRVVLPFRLTGPAAAPRVTLDAAALRAAAEKAARRGLRDRVRDELGKTLGRLFGGGGGRP